MNIPDLRREKLKELSRFEPLEVDPHWNKSGVLLSDEIEYYATQHNMIHEFNRDNLKPAAYELTIDGEYYIDGEFHNAKEENDYVIKVPEFQVVVLKTNELLCLPRFIIARWNLRIHWSYKGLLWLGASQVDPGYLGNMFCPIFNLSDRPVLLKVGEPIAQMDFVKTTHFDVRKGTKSHERYKHPKDSDRVILQEYEAEDLKSALFSEAGQKIPTFHAELEKMDGKISSFITIVLATLAILIGLVASNLIDKNSLAEIDFWSQAIFSLFIFMFSFSVLNFLNIRAASFLGINPTRIAFRGYWVGSTIFSFLVAFAAFAFALSYSDKWQSSSFTDALDRVQTLEKKIIELETRISRKE